MLAPLGMAGERVVLETIMVRVNDSIITITDFRHRLLQELSRLTELPKKEELGKIAERLLQNIVDEQILLERAREKQLTVDEETIDRALAGLREESNLEDDTAFEEALKSSGMSMEQLRDHYRHTILLQKTVQSEIQPVEITNEEVRGLYEREKERFKLPKRVKLQQIFLPILPETTNRDEVLRRAQSMLERVKAGSDLTAEATLAGVEVQDLGVIPEVDLRPELAAALANLNPGDFTVPIETTGGIQIIRLIERIPEGYQPYDEVKNMLRRDLSQRRYKEQSDGMIERLKKEFLVEVHPDLIDIALAGLADA